MTYPKINTLWKRDEKTHKIVRGDFACPEFNAIKKWRIGEKVNGTNTRLILERKSDSLCGGGIWTDSYLTFKGKTDTEADNLPEHLVEYLNNTFTKEKIRKIFPTQHKIVLFGEGYGIKINNGGSYRKDVSFILFDVFIDNKWWLEQKNVHDVAKKLGIDYVPDLGVMTWEEAEKLVQGKSLSKISKETMVAEGIVARSEPLMYFRKDEPIPIMWKLKVKDYGNLRI